jgi:SAM-dependent methyltransferase
MKAIYGWSKNLLIGRRASKPDLSMRDALRNYIRGKGIEIGALHRPLDLTDLAVPEIKYLDRHTEEELHQIYQIDKSQIIPVDILDDGEHLEKIADESLDFIIANHFIEHARDPIRTLENWWVKLRKGGRIFLVVPDKRTTFDQDRPLTRLEHLIEDYRTGTEQRKARDSAHFEEWVRLIEKRPADEVEGRVRFLMEVDYSIHYHTFTMPSFLQLIEYLRKELNLPWRLIACAETLPPEVEFVVVLEKSEG